MPPKVYVGPPQALPPLKPNVTIRCRGQSGKWCYGDVTDVESRTVQWQDGFTGFPQEGEKVRRGAYRQGFAERVVTMGAPALLRRSKKRYPAAVKLLLRAARGRRPRALACGTGCLA